ncbi:MAG: hypothetical protein ACK528_03435 [Alphaproteobacteria bacterium]
MMRSVCDTDKVDAWHNEFWTVTQDELERFAKLVAAHEREACAKVCFGKPGIDAWECAAAIRSRGEVQP